MNLSRTAVAVVAASALLLTGCNGESKPDGADPTSTEQAVAPLPDPAVLGPFTNKPVGEVKDWLYGSHMVEDHGRVWMLTQPADGQVAVTSVDPARPDDAVSGDPWKAATEGNLSVITGRPVLTPDLVKVGSAVYAVWYDGSTSAPTLHVARINTASDTGIATVIKASDPIPTKGGAVPAWAWYGQALMVYRGPANSTPTESWYVNGNGELKTLPNPGGKGAYLATASTDGKQSLTIKPFDDKSSGGLATTEETRNAWINGKKQPWGAYEVIAATGDGFTVNDGNKHLLAYTWAGKPISGTGYDQTAEVIRTDVYSSGSPTPGYVKQSPDGAYTYAGWGFLLHHSADGASMVPVHVSGTELVGTVTDEATYVFSWASGDSTDQVARGSADGFQSHGGQFESTEDQGGQGRIPVYATADGYGFFPIGPGGFWDRDQLTSGPVAVLPPA